MLKYGPCGERCLCFINSLNPVKIDAKLKVLHIDNSEQKHRL